MKIKLTHLILCFVSLCFTVAVHAETIDKKLDKDIKNFISEQFKGTQDMFGNVAFSKKYLAKLRKENFTDVTEENASYHDFTTEPCVIVTGYNILEIKQVSKKGTVKIKFQEIADRVKDKKTGRVILLKKKQESEVIYDLILKNGNWVVLDPPEPRISLQAITSQFEDQMKILNSSNWQKTTGMDQEQIRSKKEIYSNFKSSYEEIKSLK